MSDASQDVPDETICDKCEGKSKGFHECPFAREILDNYDDEYCNCCDSCQGICRDEI